MPKSAYIFQSGEKINVGTHGEHNFVYAGTNPVSDGGNVGYVQEAGTPLGSSLPKHWWRTGGSHTAVSTHTMTGPTSASLAWSRDLDPNNYEGYGTAHDGQGTVFYPNGTQTIYALDEATGNTKYKISFSNAWTATDPAWKNDTLYYGTDSFVAAHEAKSGGSELWRNTNYDQAYFTSPVVVSGLVIFGWVDGLSDGRIIALDTADGSLVWEHNLSDWTRGGPFMDKDAKVVFTADNNGKLYRIAVSDGTEEWQVDHNFSPTGLPAYAGGTIFIDDTSGGAAAVDATDGSLIWHTTNLSNANGGSIGYHNGMVFYGGADSNLFYALDSADGSVIYKTSSSGIVDGGGSIATENAVSYWPNGGHMHALDDAGNVLWHYSGSNTNGAFEKDASASGGRVFCATDTGYLYAFE